MKRNQNFDHNHSQKVFSCRYNMDTNRVEARFEDGTTLSIDCISATKKPKQSRSCALASTGKRSLNAGCRS